MAGRETDVNAPSSRAVSVHGKKRGKGTMEWNGPNFKRKAAAIGPYTEDVITHVLASRKYEVQSYRQCIGILGFAKKYSRKALEACFQH